MERNIVLVTGATGGIGKESAFALAGAGVRVIATGRNPDKIEALEEEARARGVSFETARLDVTDNTSIIAAKDEVDRLTEGYGLDVLVNNAGFGLLGAVETLTREKMLRQFDTNLFGLLEVTRTFLPAMLSRGSGRIVNVSSIGAHLVLPMMGAYCASKFALDALAEALRIEVGGRGVTVTNVEPGFIKTGFSTAAANVMEDIEPDDPFPGATYLIRTDAENRLRIGSPPEKVARTVVRACAARRPKARYVTPALGWLTLRSGQLVPKRLFRWAGRRILGRMDRMGRKRMA